MTQGNLPLPTIFLASLSVSTDSSTQLDFISVDDGSVEAVSRRSSGRLRKRRDVSLRVKNN